MLHTVLKLHTDVGALLKVQAGMDLGGPPQPWSAIITTIGSKETHFHNFHRDKSLCSLVRDALIEIYALF